MIIKNLGITDYQQTYLAMQKFTKNRSADNDDELWITQHNPVFTQGLSSKSNINNIHNITIINTDRGGKTTYHGLGQIVIYCLLDLTKYNYGIKKLVYNIEQSVIDLLSLYKISATRKDNAHGVYVNGAKISSLGLKIRRSKTYHGLSLNVDMDLTPFSFIDPCGYKNLKVTQMKILTKKPIALGKISQQLCKKLISKI